MHFENLKEINANSWWYNKLWEYNKKLLVIGIICFIVCALICAALCSLLMPLALLGFAMLYMAYVVMANVFFALGWITDVYLNHHNDGIFRTAVFNVIYWISVLLPPGILLTFMETHYLDAMFDFKIDL